MLRVFGAILVGGLCFYALKQHIDGVVFASCAYVIGLIVSPKTFIEMLKLRRRQ